MKKTLVWMLCALLALAGAGAENAEKVSVVVGETVTVQPPFAMESYRVIPSGSKIVAVETMENSLRVIGQAVGEVNVVVSGGGVQRDYVVTVRSNLSNILRNLRRDLDEITELDASLNDDKIVIKGTVSNPEHWTTFQKVLPRYSKDCLNLAVFRPSPETFAELRKLLTDAGFRFAASEAAAQTGELTMRFSQGAVVLTGEFYSQSDVDKINQILSTQTWLVPNGAADPAQGQVRGIVNLTVIESMLQVDIVYVGLTKQNSDTIGTSGTPTLGLKLTSLYDFVAERNTDKNFTFGGNMDQTVSFLANNGVNRIYNAGHVSFLNNDPTGGKLHTGGTIKARVSGTDNGDIKDINYGLTITVSGGLLSEKKAKLKLKLEDTFVQGMGMNEYDLKTDETEQQVICPLDKTIVLAGSQKIVQQTRKSGLPFLRNTPVLQWFCAGQSDDTEDIKLLVLACPRLVKYNPDTEIEIPLDKTTAPTYRDAKRDNNVRIEEEKRHRGSLRWLDWFSW